MVVYGLPDTATVNTHTTALSNGRVVESDSELDSSWKCRISLDNTHYARQERGRGGRSLYTVVGNPTSYTISEGDTIVVSSVTYRVVAAFLRRDQYGNEHHWFLQVAKEV